MPRVTQARVSAVSPRLLDLVPSFQRHLRAERKAPRTVESYTEAVRRLHDFLAAQGMPLEVANITGEHIEAFMEDQQARLRPSSARVRYASLIQFFKWVIEDGERTDSPMPRLHLVVPDQPVAVLRLEELRALLRTVERDTGFYGRRDAAVVRLFDDTARWPLPDMPNSRPGWPKRLGGISGNGSESSGPVDLAPGSSYGKSSSLRRTSVSGLSMTGTSTA
jgi:hypothetical protein